MNVAPGSTAPRGERPAGRPKGLLLALAACLALAIAWVPPVSMERSMGWDESMHAELPAARALVALQAGAPREAVRAMLDCQQYPPAWPALLCLAQSTGGPSELAGRRLGRLAWVAALAGLFLLARELAPTGPGPWIAFGLGALSPLALAYSGSFFLEVPFAAASVFALRAWLARRRLRAEGAPRGRALRAELAAGAWIALVLFTKWNYGLLLGAGLFLDWAVDLGLELRAARLADFLRRSLALVAVPLLACLWWFGWPLPGDLALGASHRAAALSFLSGNQDASMHTAWSQRLLHWSCFFAPTPRVLVLELLGLALALGAAAARGAAGGSASLRSGVRTLFLVLVASALPVALHNFHLDRFLIPAGIPLWALAGVGLARLLPVRPAPRALALAALAAAALALPSLDTWWAFTRLVPPSGDPALTAHQRVVVAGLRDLRGGRDVPTAGLPRAAHDACLDLLAAAAGPRERVAWLGANPELSPAVIQLGLLARGGSPERFRAEAARARADGVPDMIVTHELTDPGWDDARIRAWAAGFDLVFTSIPMDWKGRRAAEPLKRYLEVLLTGTWRHTELGRIELPRPLGPPVPIQVFACRPGRG